MGSFPFDEITSTIGIAASAVAILGALWKIGAWLLTRVSAWRSRPRPEKELGYFDLLKLSSMQMTRATRIQQGMTNRTTRYTDSLRRYTDRLRRAQASGSKWRVVWADRRAARLMNRYARGLRRDVRRYSDRFRAALRTAIRAGEISSGFMTGEGAGRQGTE